ncbi:hypothetical protein CBR_g46293 [Chara braunii]|uniref:Uncharacterized protein n=1 Tax=Chara braunii TaxID=69332 RepID=A0A388M085_CHABU|nr:hypothetical protein CBR_g46293 [Chara braunii]|eukprot:GBG87925.1 hypothetical protein CBR_g46293 [Chara braunii]
MWRPGEEEEMGMPLVSTVSQAVLGAHVGMGEDDCDWGEEEVFDHGYEDASDGDETASEGSFISDSGDLGARRDSFNGSSVHHHHDYEEDDHVHYAQAVPSQQQQQHEQAVPSISSRKRGHAAADVSSSETSSDDVSSREVSGEDSGSSSSNRGRSGVAHVGLIRPELRGVGLGGGATTTDSSTLRASSGVSAARLARGGAAGGGCLTVGAESVVRLVHNGQQQLSTSGSAAALPGATCGGNLTAGRCGLVENFGVGGAPIGMRMCGSSAADMPAAGTAGAVHGGFPERDLPSLSSPRMQSKWLGVMRNSSNTRSKPIPTANQSVNGPQKKGLSFLSSTIGGGGGAGGGGGGAGGARGGGCGRNDVEVAVLPKWQQSAPVNFAHVAAERKMGGRWAYSPQSDDDDVGDNDWNNEIRIYPHELVARTKYSHKMVAFSVADGRGGTLKGRELRRLRDLILRQVMGYESRYPDGTLHEQFRPAIALNVMD